MSNSNNDIVYTKNADGVTAIDSFIYINSNQSQQEISLPNVNFSNAFAFSPVFYDIQPAHLIDYTETFASNTGQLAGYTANGGGGTVVLANNTLTISQPSASNTTLFDLITDNTAALTIPQAFISVDNPVTLNTNCSADLIGVGIAANANNWVLAMLDRSKNRTGFPSYFLTVYVNQGGSIVTGQPSQIPGGSGNVGAIGLAMIDNTFTAYYKDKGNTAIPGQWDTTYSMDLGKNGITFDFRVTGAMAGWYPCVAKTTTSNTAIGETQANAVFSNLVVGRYGGQSVRDISIVSNPDGTPYTTGLPTGEIKIVATIGGPGDQFGAILNSNSYMAVMTANLGSGKLTQNSVIYFTANGMAQSHHSGHIIAYPNGNCQVFVSSLGQVRAGIAQGANINVLYTVANTSNVLVGTNLLGNVTMLALPKSGAAPGTMDPSVVFDTSNNRWLAAYTVLPTTNLTSNNYYASIAFSPDLVTWTLINNDNANTGFSGTRLVKSNSQYYMTAVNPAARTGNFFYPNMYDASGIFIELVSYGTPYQLDSTLKSSPFAIFPYGGFYYMLSSDQTVTEFNVVASSWGQPWLMNTGRYVGGGFSSNANSHYRLSGEVHADQGSMPEITATFSQPYRLIGRQQTTYPGISTRTTYPKRP